MTVVAGVDGSEGSRRALAWAVEEARLRKDGVRAVLAWSFMDQPEGFDPGYGEKDARRRLDEVVAGLGQAADGVAIERVVVCDLATHALLGAAAGADLLVVGSRGVGGFRGLLLGSVSQQLASHAPCPLVIVPGEERAG